jgi:hypothetical protein
MNASMSVSCNGMGMYRSKIERVAEALSCDRSSAIRWMINDALEQGRTSILLWSGKGSRFADQIARSVVLGFKAKAANAAVSRAVPADRVEAENKALRSVEAAEESLTRLGDRIALGEAAKPQRRRRSTVLEPAPVAALLTMWERSLLGTP